MGKSLKDTLKELEDIRKERDGEEKTIAVGIVFGATVVVLGALAFVLWYVF